nr:sugar-binding domain-containing protein [uncultured Draconibacterium sp.]
MNKNLLLTLTSLLLISSGIYGQNSWKKKIISLNSKDQKTSWQFLGTSPQDGNINIPDLSLKNWQNISVPGDVNVELMNLGILPDLHFDTLAREAYWVTEKDWWYTLLFDADFDTNKKTDLVLDFVDGNSEIWLNGTKLGIMENAFYPHRFDVKSILKAKNNRLFIRFKSINKLLGGERLDELLGWRDRRSFIRKPQYNFGWDWTLPVPGIGLAGNVYIENGNEFEIEELGIQTTISGQIDFNFEVTKPTKEAGYEIIVNVDGHETQLSDTIRRTDYKTYKSYTHFLIENPRLWWPNGYGEPNLYNYNVQLLVDGVITDTRKGKFGIRETETRERPFTPDAGVGYSFEVLINNEPIFCKGTNWIPMEIWPGAIDTDKYRFYLEKAKEANFNMIRVWGGGIYEKDLFYELCDEMGIMVWQDFMFASTGYPVNHLMVEIIKEAEYQVFRLRNHPSIVIWCGGNEDYLSWRHPKDAEYDAQADIVTEIEKDSFYVDRTHEDPILFSMILRGLTTRFGLNVPYVDSSPMSREDSGNRPNSGNSHVSCWKYALFWCDGKPSRWRNHFNNVCSFDSEFCIQGPSNVNTIKSFLKEVNYWPPNDAWIYHIQRGHANLPHYEQTMFIAGDIFGEINSLQEYVKYGQATHVEQTRTEYESARYDRPNNGGTMSWMFNDCWPTSNWSIIDYYYQPKPAYYAAKRACSPVLPIIFERDSIIRFSISNETAIQKHLLLTYGCKTISGDEFWQKEEDVQLEQNSIVEFFRENHSNKRLPLGSYLYIKAIVDGKQLDDVIYFPDGWKNIDWETPSVVLKIINQEKIDGVWQTDVQVSSDKFVRLCHLTWNKAPKLSKEMPLPNVWFNDNFFDLQAGNSKTVTITSSDKIKLDELSVGHWLTDWK